MKGFKTFDRPWLILCEGQGDKYVLDKRSAKLLRGRER